MSHTPGPWWVCDGQVIQTSHTTRDVWTLPRRLLCWLTGHRLTVVHHWMGWGMTVGRSCRCGHRSTVILSDGTEREGT